MMDPTVRQPAVAGTFYPGTAAGLNRQVREFISEKPEPHRLLACIAPHAGYVYSGGVAGALYGHLDVPRDVVILGPNHTGIGAPVAVAPHARWSTPSGDRKVGVELAAALVERYRAATFDADAHRGEHSIEVQLPFLSVRQPKLEFVPVCLGHMVLEECLELGRVLAEIIRDHPSDVGLVASSDMTHYRPDYEARKLDRKAIDAALELDPASLYETVHREGISMCGVVPATVALAAANELGAVAAHLVAYATSGDINNDRSAVVGYAGICIHR
ncbi:MAG: AmmeMemoRadiSam system protein B [Thermoanaerobaculales bacterium]